MGTGKWYINIHSQGMVHGMYNQHKMEVQLSDMATVSRGIELFTDDGPQKAVLKEAGMSTFLCDVQWWLCSIKF